MQIRPSCQANAVGEKWSPRELHEGCVLMAHTFDTFRKDGNLPPVVAGGHTRHPSTTLHVSLVSISDVFPAALKSRANPARVVFPDRALSVMILAIYDPGLEV
jgi:hypothetical protein